jgi:hypothetical protein
MDVVERTMQQFQTIVQSQRHHHTPDQPRRELSKVLERLARAICARHNDCLPGDRYTDLHWPSFQPGAEVAYQELLKIDQERATNQKGKTL